jgi:hypothetical protein
MNIYNTMYTAVKRAWIREEGEIKTVGFTWHNYLITHNPVGRFMF